MIDIIVGYYWIFVLVRDSASIVNIKSIFNSENVLVSVIFFFQQALSRLRLNATRGSLST